MKLAIADPPYPPRVYDRPDAAGGALRRVIRSRARRWYGDQGPSPRSSGNVADFHPDAAYWDTPEAHRALIERLHAEFDGWALATTLDGADWYHPLPPGTRHMVWHKPNSMPNGSRLASSCELVLVYIPHGRRLRAAGRQMSDLLVAAPPNASFAGAKPASWTRWVLDALGYDPDVDELHDLFPGSGMVAAAAAQGVLL
jgi:hypothetical protein